MSGERLTNSGRAGYGRREGLQPHMLSRNMPVPPVLPTCSKTGLSLPILVSFFRQPLKTYSQSPKVGES